MSCNLTRVRGSAVKTRGDFLNAEMVMEANVKVRLINIYNLE
jgi:hypothetical protein